MSVARPSSRIAPPTTQVWAILYFVRISAESRLLCSSNALLLAIPIMMPKNMLIDYGHLKGRLGLPQTMARLTSQWVDEHSKVLANGGKGTALCCPIWTWKDAESKYTRAAVRCGMSSGSTPRQAGDRQQAGQIQEDDREAGTSSSGEKEQLAAIVVLSTN